MKRNIKDKDLEEYFQLDQNKKIEKEEDIIKKFDLDSLGIFNFILFLEERSGVEFFSNDIDVYDLKSINRINNFISKHKQSGFD